jgi:hypothetical protein
MRDSNYGGLSEDTAEFHGTDIKPCIINTRITTVAYIEFHEKRVNTNLRKISFRSFKKTAGVKYLFICDSEFILNSSALRPLIGPLYLPLKVDAYR